MRKNALLKKIEKSAIAGVDRYFTKPKLAKRIVDWMLRSEELIYLGGPTKKLRFLEPSAGGGSFVDALLEASTEKRGYDIHVTAVELDTVLAARLERKYANEPRVKVVCGDFLQFKMRPGAAKPFDAAVMNPPYGSRENGTVAEDAKHVRHALRFADSVVGLLVTGFEHGERRARRLFDEACAHRRVVLAKRPGFEGPEDKGESARRDHVVLQFRERGDMPPDVAIMVDTERWELDKEGEPVLIHQRTETEE